VGEVDGLIGEASRFPYLMPDLQTALGLGPDTFTAHIGHSGSGIVATPMVAKGAAAAGQGSTFLCVYGISLSDDGGAGAYHEQRPFKANLEMPIGYFPQPVWMAAMANRYLAVHGLDAEQLGHVPISSRDWASLHPAAERRQPITMKDYRASEMVSTPYRMLDCCLVGDGAAALLLTTRERARDLPRPAITVAGVHRAVEPFPEQEYLSVRREQLGLPSRWSGPAALRQAGLTFADIDVAYLYDCFSIIPVLQLEDMGFCEAGQGLNLFASGATRPGGRLPVNTHGGLMSHSFVPGINMIIEAVTQLRGQAGLRQVTNARAALVGGWAAHEHSTLVLTTEA
jgi:acetyl-CoA acetyltransferase